MKKIILKNGKRKHLPLLSEGEIAFCTDSLEFYIGSDEGNHKFTEFQYLLSDLYLVPDKNEYKFKIHPDVVAKITENYKLNLEEVK